MPNPHRGDSELVAGNNRYTMRLTLGALAEIEDALGLSSLGDIAMRLKSLATSDIAAVASALLRGGGHNISAADVLKFECDLGSIVRAIAGAFDAAGLSHEANGSSPAERGRGTIERSEMVEGADSEARESVFAKENTRPLAGAASSNSPSG
jgi:Phage tail tube protein, GTA-gp10